MITYWGIDGCKGGWIAIGLSETNEKFKAVYIPSISDFWQEHGHLAKAVLIDMPIGLADDEKGRLAEKSARDVLKKRRSSVFAVPTRSAIAYGATHGFTSENYAMACKINKDVEGKKFSKQSWNISAKIHEVNQFLVDTPPAQSILKESHPEVLFWALNHRQPIQYGKKMGLGFVKRLNIISLYQSNALDIVKHTYKENAKWLEDDDIMDALVCAVCARLGNFATLPPNPRHDAKGLPMQMVYPSSGTTLCSAERPVHS